MDFVIVGGGVYGCGVAWELARQGADVLLLEAKTVASGASGGLGKRSVRANGRDRRELPLMRRAYELWPDLHERLDGTTGYVRSGHLLLIERARDRVAAPAHAWMQERQGIPTRLIEQDELQEMEPHLSDAVTAALFCPKDGVADHTATTRSYAQAAQRLGAVVRAETAVVQLEQAGERVAAVVTDQGERIPIDKKLLLLCNSTVPTLLQAHFGVTLPVWKRLPQVMLTEPVDPVPVRHLIGHGHRVLAMKSGPNQSVMISGGWMGRWNEAKGVGETQPDQVAGNLGEAVAVYPSLAGIGVAEAAADRLETETIDHIPIIDHVPGAPNTLFATGWCGHGWAIAPAVCEQLAAWALSGERPELLRPFRYSRF